VEVETSGMGATEEKEARGVRRVGVARGEGAREEVGLEGAE
jgi:hypothetical protein